MTVFTSVRAGLVAALLGSSGSLALAQEASETRFRVTRNITIPTLTRDELIAVPLDAEVFREAETSLADLRVEGPPGTWNAFVLRNRKTARERQVDWTDTAEEVQLRPLVRTAEDDEEAGKGEQGIEVRFRASPKRAESPTEIRIVTPLTDFEQRVRVLDDLSGELLQDGLIFDYSRFMDVRETAIPLPVGDHRRFRMVIDSPTSEQASQLRELSRRLRPDDPNRKTTPADETEVIERRIILDRPFRIDRVELRGMRIETKGERDLEVEYPVRSLQTSEDRASRQTVLELQTDRTPTSRLDVSLEGKNFSRSATVESGTERHGSIIWQRIGSATLVHLDFQGQRRENRTIAVTRGIHPRLRVRIENRDSPPLPVRGVTLRGASQEVVFIGEPNVAYRLHYGASDAVAPQYDVAAIEAALGARSRPIEATLGSVLPGTVTIDLRPGRKRAPWNDPWVLGSIIAILGAVLGLVLVRAGRIVSEMPEESPPNESSGQSPDPRSTPPQ